MHAFVFVFVSVFCLFVCLFWPATASWALPAGMGPFEGSHLYLHYLHHSLASGQTTGREHSPTHQQKIGLKIY